MEATGQLTPAPRGVRLLAALKGERLLPIVALLAIFGLALGLRLYGLDWDRGYSYTPHPDERAILMKIDELSLPSPGQLDVLLNADDSPWNPRWFPYGSLPLYLLKGVQLVYSAWPGAELHDLRIAGRTVSALADVGTVALVYLLATRLFGRREGLLASALLALTVMHIQLSHFYAVDTLLGLFTVAALYFLYRVASEGGLGNSVLAGAFIGLGVATKVSQVPIYAAFVMAHLLFLFSPFRAGGGTSATPGDRTLMAVKGLAAGAMTSLVVIMIVQPYAFLDWSRFFADVIEQSEMVRRIRDYPYTRQYIDTIPYWYHVSQLGTWGLGWPLGILAWGGLLYASLRGMRPTHGLAYLALGWGAPLALLLYSASFAAMLVASGISFLALLATLPLRSHESRGAVLLLSWVVPYFLITGAFQVKFIRYLTPITPLLVLLGSRMAFALWDDVKRRRPVLRPWLVAGLFLLVGGTGFYALSYMAIYGEPHTAVRTAQWINSNAPEGSVVLREHWEEGLPNLSRYEERILPMYEDDGPEKLRRLSEDLADADYLVFFSNRLYGTIPRLPERYPISGEYYRLLFSEALGYRLVEVETAYPRLAGVSFVDDTFRRPDLPMPPAVSAALRSSLAINLGYADESFSVYDHPMGLVFQNVQRYDAATIRRTIEDAVPHEASTQGMPLPNTMGLLLSPGSARAQRQGGTWSEIIHSESWTNRLPVLAWLLLVEGIALLTLPLSLALFRPLADRGYLLSKVLGLLFVGLVVWLLASVQLMSFSRWSITLALLLLGAISAVAFVRRRQQLVDFVRRRWPILLIGELVFLAAFFALLILRMANPDLWHPFRGGEKPMDLAYLNAVLRSSYMPPFDPWFGGGYLNYYYFGHFIVATLVKATGIDPTVAFNLAVPLFFALTAAAAFSIVYNLAERSHQVKGAGSTPSGRGRRTHWPPVLAGIGGTLFVTVLGNLDGAIQAGQGFWRVLVRNMPFGEFDFWRSTRMMPPDPPGHEITEFPFFTFLFADLHAHLMAMPFTLLALGLALAVLFGPATGRIPWVVGHGALTRRGWGIGELARLLTLGVAIGALPLLNAWDFPTYALIAVGAILLGELFRNGGFGLTVLVTSALKAALMLLVGYLVFLPFHLNYEAFFTSLEVTTNQTVLWQFLAISGLFIFIIGSYFVSELWHWLVRPRRLTVGLAQVSLRGGDADVSAVGRGLGGFRPWATMLAAALTGLVLATILSIWLGSTIPFLMVMVALAIAVGLRSLNSFSSDAPSLAFAVMVVIVALTLAIGLDLFRVEGDIDRMNSVFKFYLQMWVLLALASAYFLWRLANGRRTPIWRLPLGKKAWFGTLLVLIASVSVYPVLGTQDRLRDRFNGRVTPMTLDGTAYMEGTVYRDQKGDIDLAADYEGIRWLLGVTDGSPNVKGSPIVLEGITPTYRWGGRVSVYTGLPSVVGWQWHQEQQRWGYRPAIGERIDDVNRIYSTTDATEALSLMRKYGVEYVYVGQLERLYYPGEGIGKFDQGLNGHLEEVFQSEHVRIYRFHQGDA